MHKHQCVRGASRLSTVILLPLSASFAHVIWIIVINNSKMNVLLVCAKITAISEHAGMLPVTKLLVVATLLKGSSQWSSHTNLYDIIALDNFNLIVHLQNVI